MPIDKIKLAFIPAMWHESKYNCRVRNNLDKANMRQEAIAEDSLQGIPFIYKHGRLLLSENKATSIFMGVVKEFTAAQKKYMNVCNAVLGMLR